MRKENARSDLWTCQKTRWHVPPGPRVGWGEELGTLQHPARVKLCAASCFVSMGAVLAQE